MDFMFIMKKLNLAFFFLWCVIEGITTKTIQGQDGFREILEVF